MSDINKIRSWQRLEPTSRDSEMSDGIQATIHDPAWMLARQWQLGEFEGEDAGSPISVSLSTMQHKISKVIVNNNAFNYEKDYPLEVLIERTKLEIATQKENGDSSLETELDLQSRVKLGLQFQREIDIQLKDIVQPAEEINKFKKHLAKDPNLTFKELNSNQEEFEMEITKTYLSIIKGRVIDIYRIIVLADDGGNILKDKANEFFANSPNVVSIGNALDTAIKNLKHWWNGNIASPIPDEQEEPFFETLSDNNISAWNSRHLEYNFKVQIDGQDNDDNNNNMLILDAAEYKEDHLDWYSFTVDKSSVGLLTGPPVTPRTDLIPTHLKFKGIPEKRWWNFEDSYIDFGAITPKTNNIVTTLLMEFAFIHSPDWYIIPYQMEVGTISQVKSLIITDCFGDKISIEPAGRTVKELAMSEADKSWDSWSMFLLSKKYEDKGQQQNTPYFFLPPAVDNVISGLPLEEIKFLRDETANLVWAVEKKYRTLYGEPISGYDHYISQSKNVPTPASPDHKDSAKYTLMTSVPWNWIPFIPVHTTELLTSSVVPPTHMHIELQRAAMVNPITGNTLIRPNSRLLNENQPRYYIDESEIPSAGAIFSEKCQRTVWSNGRVFLWIGRKKLLGSGEGYSGLKFDSIPLKKKL